MSYFDDYIADGLCCECCGEFLGDEPGFVRRCSRCEREAPEAEPRPKLAEAERLPFSCQIGRCGQRFASKAAKARHRRSVHGSLS